MHAAPFSDRVLIVTGDYFDEHMTVIDTGEGLIVVDTLATMPATRDALSAIGAFSRAPVRVVINTHLDVDHVAGNHLFSGAAIVSHAGGLRHLHERVFDDPESEREIRAFVATLESARLDAGADTRLERYVAGYRTLLDGFGDFVPAPPTVFVAGGSAVAVGGTILELHHFGPAHTDADLVVWVPSEGLAIAGDAVMGADFTPAAHPAHGGSISGLLGTAEALERMLPADARLLPGHGRIGGLELLERQREYARALLDAARRARADGLSLDDARPAMHIESFANALLYDYVQPGHIELAWKETGIVGGAGPCQPD